MAGALKRILTLCLVLGLTSIAQGQDRHQPGHPSVLGPVLSNPGVQKELKLSDEQINKLKDALGKVQEKYRDDFARFQLMSLDERIKKMKEVSKDFNKSITAILHAKQLKRFRQIEWQRAGIGALGDWHLQEELKLSDEQQKKLNGIFYDFEKKMDEMARNRERSLEKYQALAKGAETKASGVLSEEQKKNLKELMGPPFELSPPPTPKR